jgi:hypothetical protein
MRSLESNDDNGNRFYGEYFFAVATGEETQDMAYLGTVRNRDGFVMVKLQIVMGERGPDSILCYSKSPCFFK